MATPLKEPDLRTYAARPLGPVPGTEIEGVDLRHPCAPATVATNQQALLRYQMIISRDQDSSDNHLGFTSRQHAEQRLAWLAFAAAAAGAFVLMLLAPLTR